MPTSLDAALRVETVAGAAGGVDLTEGQFIGYASVFGNVDAHGDVIASGAFTRTLADRKSVV